MKKITKRNFFKGLAFFTLSTYLSGKSSNLLAHSEKKMIIENLILEKILML